MRPIKRTALYEKVVKAIETMLRNGEFKIGDRLPTEAELAKAFRVSRNSVREALKVLTIAGALESIPGKGTFVRPEAGEAIIRTDGLLSLVKKASLVELMEVRKALEIEAAGLAARRASEEEIQELQETWQELRAVLLQEGDWSAVGHKHHLLITQLSGNELLVKLIRSIGNELKAYRKVLVGQPSFVRDQHFKDHEELSKTIASHDEVAAREVMKRHLQHTEAALQETLGRTHHNSEGRGDYNDS